MMEGGREGAIVDWPVITQYVGIDTYIYIYIHICVCVCVAVSLCI